MTLLRRLRNRVPVVPAGPARVGGRRLVRPIVPGGARLRPSGGQKEVPYYRRKSLTVEGSPLL